MRRPYAKNTVVSAEKSRAELEELLRAAGATEINIWTSQKQSQFAYRIAGRMVRHVVDYPELDSFQKQNAKGTALLKADQLVRAADQEWRRRWRALVLIVKAKLEMVGSGCSTFEQEFLADILLPDGTTVGAAIVPKLERAYKTGLMPKSFLSLPAGED